MTTFFKGHLILGILLTTLSLQATATDLETSLLLPDDYTKSPVPLKDELDIDQLLTTVKDKRIRTVDEALALLPPHMVEQNYVVMYLSRSIQGASPDSPRIITYTPSGRFSLTYNGGKRHQKGGHSLELMQFRSQTSTFEFREIQFDPAGKDLPKISDVNPAKCIKCHQSRHRSDIDPRPNWEPYDIWPGALGSVNGIVQNDDQSGDYRLEMLNTRATVADRNFMRLQTKEKEFEQQFLDLKKNHPRYKMLGQFVGKNINNFTEHIARLNGRRILRLLRQDPEMLKALMPLLRSGCDSTPLQAELEKTHGRIRRQPRQPMMFHNVSPLFELTYDRQGIDTSDWSMDFGTRGRLGLIDRFTVPDFPEGIFMYAISHLEQQPLEIQSPETCTTLMPDVTKAISAAISKREAEGKRPFRPPVADARGILRNCNECHSTGQDEAPIINFNDPEGFKQIWRDGKTLKEFIEERTHEMVSTESQMPPDQRLIPEESAALKKFLDSL